MKTNEFRFWLRTYKTADDGTVAARIANCLRVEEFYKEAYKNLDDVHAEGYFDKLIEEFRYSTDDARQNRPQRHKVSINGNIRTGSATLKSALVLYKEFLGSAGRDRTQPAPMPPRPPPAPKPSDWPRWDEPSDDEALHLAKVMAPHVRFLHPNIVRTLADDNDKMRSTWCDGLRAAKIDPEVYLWTRSPCAFPGVRRHAGGAEVAIYRGHKTSGPSQPLGALRLDDNDFPKHLWSFVLRGRPFQKFGPEGYSLAHLIDHKDHQNRAAADFELVPEAADVNGRLYGLYTCPTNTVYVPRSFVKPTDFNGRIRHLLIRRAQELYGSFCSVVPPFMRVRRNTDVDWDTAKFEWSDPVGDMTHVPAFLTFRAEKLKGLMDDRSSTDENVA